MIVLTAVYFLAGKFGLALAFEYTSASPVWPPTGIALAALLLYGVRYWPAIFLGAFLVNITTAGTVLTSLIIAGGNTLESVVCCLLIRQYVGTSLFSRVEHVALLMLFAMVASGLSATIGITSLIAGGFASANDALLMWLTWWMGDVGGALIVAPLILLWSQKGSIQWVPARATEALLLCLFLSALGLIFFSSSLFNSPIHYPLSFFCLLPVLWTAIRFGPRETATLVVFLACMAFTGTLNGVGPFAMDGPNTSLSLLQAFLVIASMTGLMLSVAIQERRLAEKVLEERVRERTSDLEAARTRDRANLERLRSTIRHLPMGALLLDEEGNLLELNDAYCQTFGIPLPAAEAMKITKDELLHHFLQALVHPEQHMVKVRKALDAREPIYEEEIHLKDGRIIVRDFLPISESGTHRGLLFLYRDVTRERRVDVAKSEFMSLASHQLRTPLTAIRWGLTRLQKQSSDEKILAETVKAAERMANTIETMLKISRIEAEPEELLVSDCKLSEILSTKESFFREFYQQKQHSIVIDCPDHLTLRTDATFLREIVGNLLQNSIKYTPNGGRIQVKAFQTDDTVTLEITDTGYGIPAHQQQFVFQKFFRGDNIMQKDTTGTGLGLYLVALLTKSLQGKIEMRSVEGKGTTFTLILPTNAWSDNTGGTMNVSASSPKTQTE